MSGAHTTQERWRHAWAAFVIGAIAVIALGLISFVLTTSRAHPQGAAPPVLLTEVPSHTSATLTASKSRSSVARSSHARTPSTSVAPQRTSPVAQTSAPAVVVARTAPPAAPTPRASSRCPTDRPCVVGGAAQIPAALSEYRAGHGRAGGVTGVVTETAQRCALTAGDGPSCAGPFAVAREPGLSGPAAVRDMSSGYDSWLLDPQLTGVEVGWAYLPQTGQYVCVLIERT